ncbi:MAG: helix-turn-helix domain-containing protein [Kineosporiaceae bacterium]|nr:helix-turn-helix domain-containing protein [Aeromicrobium sp.]
MTENQYLDPDQAGDYLHLTVGHLAQLRYRGQGPRYLKPTPKVVLYRRSDLDAWLNASSVEPGAA